MRVLVAEDERPLALSIREGLEAHGMEVELVFDGAMALRRAAEGTCQVVVLDWRMPQMDGLSVCQALRKARSRKPILMVTARTDVTDRVQGLDEGADDYLTKPFEIAELAARIRVLARRENVHRREVIEVADLRIDRRAQLVSRAGAPISLTRREYELLESLAANEGRIIDRLTIIHRVWGDENLTDNMVDVYIRNLRTKVDGDHSNKLIKTVRGFGYTITS